MRTSTLALGLVALTLACEDGNTESESTASLETKAPPAEAPEPQKAAPSKLEHATALRAQMGGSLVTVGDHAVELRIHRAGLVEAHVRSTDGAAVEPASVRLEVTATGKDDRRLAIGLPWNDAHRCFRGTAEAEAEAELRPEPVDVKLTVGGQTHDARLEHYALLAAPDFGGRTLVAGDYGVEVLASTDGSVRALVRDRAGAAIDGTAAVEVELPAADATSHRVALAATGSRAAFSGKAAAGVKLAPGPLQVTVKVGKNAHAGSLAQVTLAATAEHGGRLVTAGDYSLELVALPANTVAAYAFDAKGAAHASGDLDVSLDLGAEGAQAVKLAWDAPTASYRAHLDAALDLTVTPVRVAIRTDGRLHTGGCAAFAARGKLAATGGVDAKLAAGARASAKAPTVAARLSADKTAAAKAKVTTSPPKVQVKKSASATAGGDGKSGAKAGAKASIRLGL